MSEAITLSGLYGSPYTRKIIAVLRYRRIPYRFITPSQARTRGLPEARVPFFPTLYLPGPSGDIEAVTDSSPLIRRLEAEHAGRRVIPTDPAAALIDMLLEDYGDEWLTKPVFHYRWTGTDDIRRAGDVLPLWFEPTRPDQEIADDGASFSARQIGRLNVVGSSPETGHLIEASYERFIEVLGAHLRSHRFLMGSRPGAADFAIYGQLTQLAQFDPTPMALTLERAPRVYAYSTLIEDLSGEEPGADDWFTGETVPASLTRILEELGRTYVPAMLANARALTDGADRVEATVEGQDWVQQPFPYQGKCLKWLRDAYAVLEPGSRSKVDGLLAGTGCAQLFAG
jgi:glutathione S-transferase